MALKHPERTIRKQVERRRSTRIELWVSANAEIRSESVRIRGKVDNLSSKGMLLETMYRIDVGSEVEISFFFDVETSTPRQLTALGTIVNHNPAGMGVRFTRIDINEFYTYIISLLEKS